MNEWEWVPKESTHDCSKGACIILGIPTSEIQTTLYDKLCELYGKAYMDNKITQDFQYLFHNTYIDKYEYIDIEIYLTLYGVRYEGWDGCNYYRDDPYNDSILYQYHEFLLISLTNKPG